MKSNISSRKSLLALAICAMFASGHGLAASAQKAAGQNENRHEDQHEDRHEERHEHGNASNQNGSHYFDDERRELVRNYYKGKKSNAACPPGLAKKGNGCLPPGQAKKWQLGQSLQANTPYQQLPRDLQSLLGVPPAGQHYGMIDEDILLLANVTELVLEVITGTD